MTRPALIIGALGQDGRLLADRLLRDGVPVVGLARPGTSARLGADAAAPHPVRELDLGDAAALEALVGELHPERVFYLAAVHHSTESAPADPLALWTPMLQVNCLGLVNTVRAVRRDAPDARLIYAASSQMYTADGEDLRVDETTPRRPRNFYAHTKAWCQETIALARAQAGLRGATAILFNHESPLRAPSFVSRKVTRAAAAIRLGRARRLEIADLGGRADWSAAEDVVDALVRMSGQDAPQDYVIGSGVVHTVEQLLDVAFGHVGLDWRAVVDAARRPPQPVVYADARRIRAELGWQPRQDFAAMVRAMVDADLAALSR
ncbi:MAG TPA: GDP-mannose 4,6-dehydratase [Candidatus Sulfotelmatobacter sp.]|nr:GDP-mannose 4,6-dehydratase [Candidatus Sulfotelmatobacter sp.]